VTTVLIPAAPAPGARKLVSSQTAYDSLTLNCAPSYTMRGGNNLGSTQNVESAYIGQELQQGWDVVVPDYEGPQSEWAVGPMLGYATLDSIRAADSFAPDGLEGARTPVGMNGYSGGAIASNWAAALAPSYAPELNIVGVAAGGIFPDLDYTISTLDNSIWYGVEIGVSVAINRAYPHYHLDSLLNPQGQALAQQDGQDASGCAGAASNEPGGTAAEYTNYPSSQALAALPQVTSVLNELNLNNAPVPAAPSFFYNAINDELAHIQPVDQLVAKYCLAGAKIDYYRDPVASEHVAGLAVYFPLALQYLQDRFAGDPVPDTCGAPPMRNRAAAPGRGQEERRPAARGRPAA
jgi:Secretory lipase